MIDIVCFISLSGCFYVTSFSIFYLEGPCTILRYSCGSRNCSVSHLISSIIVILFMKDLTSMNFCLLFKILIYIWFYDLWILTSYVLSFSLGAGPVPALLLPEIFASRIRAKAVSLSLGTHWVSDFTMKSNILPVVMMSLSFLKCWKLKLYLEAWKNNIFSYFMCV